MGKKLKVLFIFSRHSENVSDSTLTKDLSDEFSKNGADVTVVTMLERKYGRKTQLKIENNYEVLRVKTGNYFNVKNKIEKGITVLTMPRDFKKAILKYLGERKYDLIIAHTPFVSSASMIRPIKEYFKCPAYLILWDIFPQNTKDIGIIKNNILFNYFKYKEKKMLLSYDKIFCMSEGNVDYVQNNYSYLRKDKIKLLRNWAKIKPRVQVDKEEMRKKYGYGKEDILIIFGGNMGKPQKLENILYLAEKMLEDKKVKFLFIGSGTEKEKLKYISESKKLVNTNFLDYIPREDYEKLLSACDIAIVSLDERFTVPNFPSKTTDYLKLGIPILASLDKCSAEDYGIFLEEKARAGLYSLAIDKENLYSKLKILIDDEKLRKKLGENGRKFYEDNLGVDKACNIIIEELEWE